MLTSFHCRPRLLAAGAALLIVSIAFGHPEDDFCTPGEAALDPALCKMLAELDRADAPPAYGETALSGDALAQRGTLQTGLLYVRIGIGHILPGGLDHILFVLAIVLASPHIRPLLIQVSAFTVAHTVTLALAASGVVSPPTAIVEPLIAATIAWVAVENLIFGDITRWRPLLVFGFGLIHGLGFAGFFGELGLPSGQFWSALIGFNIGVEIGQLAVVAAGGLVLYGFLRAVPRDEKARHYRRFVEVPGSLLIGLTGLWWVWERLVS